MEEHYMNDEDDHYHFVPVATLYHDRKFSANALATAIEKRGVEGWDRFGRYKTFRRGDKEWTDVLDRLARQYASDTDPQPQWDDGDGMGDPVSDPYFYAFGWRSTRLPKFKESDAGHKLKDWRPSDHDKIVKTLLLIIGSLLYAIEGKLTGHGHPDFPTSEKLIAVIVDRMDGFRGMSKRTLEQYFAKARALIDKPE